MKTLSITQPWADLVAAGIKEYETRSWRTHYRGPIAIHASGALKPFNGITAADFAHQQKVELNTCPLGAIVAEGLLTDCIPTEEIVKTISEDEIARGNYNPGRWAWKLEKMIPIGPITIKGKMGLWDWKA